MFIKIDHLTYSSTNFNKDVSFFKALNYKIFFHEKKLPNLVIKKIFISFFKKTQDILLLTSKGNFNIELINNLPNNNESYIIPFLYNIPRQLILSESQQTLIKGKIIRAKLKDLDINIYHKKENDPKKFQFNKLVIQARNLKESILFWRNLGFKFKESYNNCALLEFKSIIESCSYYIYIRHSKKTKRYYLDNKGISYIALISTSVSSDRIDMEMAGYKVTEIEKAVINKKNLSIFFVIGPSGELVEVIGFDK